MIVLHELTPTAIAIIEGFSSFKENTCSGLYVHIVYV